MKPTPSAPPLTSRPAQVVTNMLQAFSEGEEGAFDQLVDLVYVDLHQLAHVQLAKHPQRELQTTALVHELYLKLVDRRSAADWRDRAHFYAACATAMRNILIDTARRRSRAKRGGAQEDLPLLDAIVGAKQSDAEWLLALDQALSQLAERDRDLALAFELRYFGGYSSAEAAEILHLAKRTIERRWNRACAWLRLAIDGHDRPETTASGTVEDAESSAEALGDGKPRRNDRAGT